MFSFQMLRYFRSATKKLRRYIQPHNEVDLSALGMAIATVVTVAEILKNSGFATEKISMKDETRCRLVQKAEIEIVLGKSEQFDKIMNAAAKAESEAAVAKKKKMTK